MSESGSLGCSSSTGSDTASNSIVDPFSQLLASMARPIPNSLTGMCEPMLTGSFGLAPTPPPLIELVAKCPLCMEPYREPKVLACFHTFCKPCLERQLEGTTAEKIVCPQCHAETQLSIQFGLDSLLTDYGIENAMLRQSQNDDKCLVFGSPSSTSSSPPLIDANYDQNSNKLCTGCKGSEPATAFCHECSNSLCANCSLAHQYMLCFENHRVDRLSHDTNAFEKICKCVKHPSQPLRYFCLPCNAVLCAECVQSDHPAHQYELVSEVADKQMAIIEALVNEARRKHADLLEVYKAVDAAQGRLGISHSRAHQCIDEAAQMMYRFVEDHRRIAIKELENVYGSKQLQLTVVDKKVQQMTEKLAQTIEFMTRLVRNASPVEVMAFKQLLHTRLQHFLAFNPDANNILQTPCEIDYPQLNPVLARQQLTAIMGAVNTGDWTQGMISSGGMPPAPIGRPFSGPPIRPPISSAFPNYADVGAVVRPKFEFGGSNQNLGMFINMDNGFNNQYEKWSIGLEPANGIPLPESPDLDFDKCSGLTQLFPPPRTQIKRQKMIYHCKFGEFGVMEGQFTEPSGVAVNAQNDIVVADTNNHRIQVFDREGHFKFQFGECGKRDGQLLYPNRVAVNRMTGDFIVTERSPTHQIQIYNQFGQFLRKFGANILQHPRGVCVDNKGHIVVIECKVMRVIIFDMLGNVLQKFSCSRYLEFPNGVCTNDKQEILISDNRAHCIKVFNYEGQFVRQIGGEGITNYPIGVGINYAGEVVVADNHNNFNLTVFNQDGAMISALESKVKHAQCFDVALVEDGSVVLASKDYRLYLYRYQSSTAN